MTDLVDAAGPPGFASLLPRLRRYAGARFRHLNPADREEAVAEVVAYAFASFVRLVRRGKDPTAFPVTFADFACRAVAGGRGLGRRPSARDRLAAGRPAGRPTVRRLDDPMPGGGWWRDVALDRRVGVPAQAAFNLDFPAWLASLPAVKRRVAELLARGHRTGEAAARVGVTPGRVAQLRRELAASWSARHAGP